MKRLTKEQRIERIVSLLPRLTEGQIVWIDRIACQFTRRKSFVRIANSDIISDLILEDFGDALRLHHCFSDEPFTKDKFEYLMVNVCKYYGLAAEKSAANNPGADIKINGQQISLKTQADKNLRIHSINIHKYMELGKGDWKDKPSQLKGLRDQFLNHLANYDRILVLRNIGRPEPEMPYWKYELVEIPKDLLEEVKTGKLEMMTDSIQTPKPGYCKGYDKKNHEKLKYELYFDGGSERKLKVNKIDKSYCRIHSSWEFIIQELEDQVLDV